MTIVFTLGAAVVFGLLLFLMFRRRVKRDEKKKSLENITVVCPNTKCSVTLPAATAWYRSGLRGDFLKCFKCGNTSIWDFGVTPPKCKGK